MAETPRKSSTARGRRGPSSLRLPSGPRQVSNPHLSLVFAQRDSTDAIPAVPVRPGASTSLSEEKLSRQLDGDLGGKQMGLRSRRSSSTTVQTVRTPSGVRSPSPSGSQAVKEEIEEEHAGSSTQLPSLDVQSEPSSEARSLSPQRLNPKVSTSWLRWNAPVPSFPKSGIVGDRGKGKELTEPTSSSATTDFGLIAEARTSRADDHLSSTVSPKPHDETASTLAIAVPGPPAPDLGNPVGAIHPPDPKSANARGWWPRISAEPPKRSGQDVESPAVRLTDDPSGISNSDPSAKVATSPSVASGESTVLRSSRNQPEDPSNSQIPSEAWDRPKQETKYPGKGWQGFFWGGGSAAQPVQDERPRLSTPDRQPIAGPPDIVNDLAASSGQVLPNVPPTTSALNTSPNPAGWSDYLYSLVVPPTKPITHPPPLPSADTPPHLAASASPTTNPAGGPAAEPPKSSLEPATPAPALHPGSGNDRRPSTTNNTGWLDYLALRSTQKKLDNTPQSMSKTAEGQVPERRGSEGVNEEVMDFSADPEFPTVSTSTVTKHDKSSMIQDKKVAQSLGTRKQRLSSSSNRSIGNIVPSPSSPKAQSLLDGKIPSAPSSSKISTSSSLPAPPQPITSQPNLVIPSFSTTFDRPPRSFLPLRRSSASQGTIPNQGKGLTAATTGLAWRALGAVGGYVYSGSVDLAKAESSSLMEDEKEARGRKEGRSIGADLPRKVGLGSGSPDDGWKGVTRVVVVGVHGWFPAKMLNSVIGEPTGTSTKFATMMGQAVKTFFEDKGVKDIRLTLMPLEGEGTIESRVDKLYKAYLGNPAWINDLRRADAIFFAAHSQGCIVTTHLISRMIAQGHIRTASNGEAVSRCEWAFGPVGLVPPEEPRRGRTNDAASGADGGHQLVCMLSMCGVHLGPMHSISTSTVIQPYLQWFENAATRELFEFQDTSSAVSLAYQKALAMVLDNGVRMVLLASLNDQVVPIYGASFSTATHPLLLRALFVDGASYTASDFMSNLLSFAFMLRNAGIDDQRLVEHLSEATAGSLTGIGHSTPYEEPACYTLAVEYLFHAGPAADPLPPLSIEPFSARDARNDFELPWIMRALVDSLDIKDLFPGELRDLKEGITQWKPVTKVLKEIKKRLEPMAGRPSRLKPLASSPSSTSLVSAETADPGMSVGSGLKRDW